jgi:hypothetical protein
MCNGVNGVDDDCNGIVDDGLGAPSVEICGDGIDNDCDGHTDTGLQGAGPCQDVQVGG